MNVQSLPLVGLGVGSVFLRQSVPPTLQPSVARSLWSAVASLQGWSQEYVYTSLHSPLLASRLLPKPINAFWHSCKTLGGSHTLALLNFKSGVSHTFILSSFPGLDYLSRLTNFFQNHGHTVAYGWFPPVFLGDKTQKIFCVFVDTSRNI